MINTIQPKGLVYSGQSNTGAGAYWQDTTNTLATDKIEAQIAARKKKEEEDKKKNLADFNSKFPEDLAFWQVDAALGANDIINNIKSGYAQKVSPYNMSLSPKDQIGLDMSITKAKKFADMSIQQQDYYKQMVNDLNAKPDAFNSDENRNMMNRFVRPDLYGTADEKKEIDDIYSNLPKELKTKAYAVTEWRAKNLEKFQLQAKQKPLEYGDLYVDYVSKLDVPAAERGGSYYDEKTGMKKTYKSETNTKKDREDILRKNYYGSDDAKRDVDYYFSQQPDDVKAKYGSAVEWYAGEYEKFLTKDKKTSGEDYDASYGSKKEETKISFIDEEDVSMDVVKDNIRLTIPTKERETVQYGASGFKATGDIVNKDFDLFDFNTGNRVTIPGGTKNMIIVKSTKKEVPEYQKKGNSYEFTPGAYKGKKKTVDATYVLIEDPVSGKVNNMIVPTEAVEELIKSKYQGKGVGELRSESKGSGTASGGGKKMTYSEWIKAGNKGTIADWKKATG